MIIKYFIKDIPEFVQGNEVLKKAWVDKWEQLVTNSFDLSDVINKISHNKQFKIIDNTRVFWFPTTLKV